MPLFIFDYQLYSTKNIYYIYIESERSNSRQCGSEGMAGDPVRRKKTRGKTGVETDCIDAKSQMP
jgi:hypothetical protein